MKEFFVTFDSIAIGFVMIKLLSSYCGLNDWYITALLVLSLIGCICREKILSIRITGADVTAVTEKESGSDD